MSIEWEETQEEMMGDDNIFYMDCLNTQSAGCPKLSSRHNKTQSLTAEN